MRSSVARRVDGFRSTGAGAIAWYVRGMIRPTDPTESFPTTARKRVVLIGLLPRAVDFSAVPGMDEAKLNAGLKLGHDGCVAAGFDAEWCLTDADWASAAPIITAALAGRPPAAVMIGAGVRAIPAHFLLFEKIINLVHELAPGARLCFNTSPESTPDAVLRWVAP